MSEPILFQGFSKIARYSRLCTITEKIDGTNGSIYIADNGLDMLIGSRTRWITPEDDNMGFAKWARANHEELLKLGPGHHFGEWWGQGIQRRYGQDRKRFSLFNTSLWTVSRPACCDVVPVLYEGMFDQVAIEGALTALRSGGSQAAPGFMNPEGICIYHQAAKMYFKKTIEGDEKPKGSTEAA